MNIPVKITVGCEVLTMPTPKSFAEYHGIVHAVKRSDTYDVMINGASRNIHISQITAFTFGGVWVTNRQFIDRW